MFLLMHWLIIEADGDSYGFFRYRVFKIIVLLYHFAPSPGLISRPSVQALIHEQIMEATHARVCARVRVCMCVCTCACVCVCGGGGE